MASSSPFLAALALSIALAACVPRHADASPAASPAAEPPARPVASGRSTAAGTSTAAHAGRQDGAHAALAASLHLQCENASQASGCVAGNLDAGDFYDVDVSPSCDADGNFAGVAEPDAPLLDALPVTGSKAQVAAKLANGQLVCILATAHAGQQAIYYYVAAIAPASVGACHGKPICNRYGERPVDFLTQRKLGKRCTLARDARPEGDCAQGWIAAHTLDVFSNGL